jgi:hypothetical protein
MATKKISSTRLLSALTLSAILLGCSRVNPRSIPLPSDSSIERQFGWALVKTAYVSLKAEASQKAAESGKLSGGTVFAPKARLIDPLGTDIGGFWYRYEEDGRSGWVHQGDLSIFNTEGQARAASTARR